VVRIRTRFEFSVTYPINVFGNVTNGDIMTKEELSHKVYLTTFIEPNYVTKIGELIYGKKELTYPKLMGKNGAVNKCFKKGWIEDITKLMKSPDDKTPGFERRIYYRAKNDPLIERINSTGLFGLENDLDKHVLDKILDSNAFRFLIKKQFIKNYKDYIKDISIDAFEVILSYLDILIIICREYEILNEYSKEIWLIDEYNKVMKKNQGDKKLMNKIEMMMKKLSEEENIPKDVKEDAVYLFVIPDNLKKPTPAYDGLSEFGKSYYSVKSVFDEFTEILEA